MQTGSYSEPENKKSHCFTNIFQLSINKLLCAVDPQ